MRYTTQPTNLRGQGSVGGSQPTGFGSFGGSSSIRRGTQTGTCLPLSLKGGQTSTFKKKVQ